MEAGDFVTQYLSARGLSFGPNSLYSNKGLWEAETRKKYPAMVAKIQAPNGEVIALQRTYLEGNRKAPIPSARKITKPITTIKGAAIRLWNLTTEDDSLAITEGVETAIAVKGYWKLNAPVWAVLSAVGLRHFNPPGSIKKLAIFCDNDMNFVGQAAAYDLASRLILEGVLEKGSVTVYCPKFGGG